MRLYLDTNILITLNEGEGPVRMHLETLLARGAENGVYFATSALTFSELLVRPYRDGKLDLANTYHLLAEGLDWLTIVPVSAEVLDIAALIRAKSAKIRLPDAIHLASACQLGCDGFLSADLGLAELQATVHPLRRVQAFAHCPSSAPITPP